MDIRKQGAPACWRHVLLGVGCGGLVAMAGAAEATLAPVAAAGDARARLDAVGVPFVENIGQIDARVRFYAPALASTLFVTNEGKLVHALPGKPAAANPVAGGPAHARGTPGPRTPGWTLIESFVGGHAQPRAGTRSTTGISTFVGEPDRHRTAVPAYEQVRLGEVFEGIDVALRATGSNVEKIFTVRPGADPGRILLRVDGATGVTAAVDGRLVVSTGNGDVAFTAPIAFQDVDGERRAIDVAYALDAARNQYGFAVGAYDRARPLVIDPLLQSTYLGAGGTDTIYAMAIHPVSGEIYVAGETTSGVSTFPGVQLNGGGAQPVYGGSFADGFVSRVSADLKTILQSTYLGAGGEDSARALAIAGTGAVYVAGYTASGTSTFPGVSLNTGGAQPAYGGGTYDAFVTRFSADLKTLVQSTYLGAAGADQAAGIAVHPATGEVYVTGKTGSNAGTFPGVGLNGGGAQGTHGGGTAGSTDAFVSRFSADLRTLLQSTYLGAAGDDYAAAIVVYPASGEIYVAGTTKSPASTFPGVLNGAQPVFGEGAGASTSDAFVSRFTADLKTLQQSTYLGGTLADEALAIAVHPVNGDVYVAGYANSAAFPGVTGGAQPAYAGLTDGFVSRLNPALTALAQSTYIGSPKSDTIYALGIHPATGDVFAAGGTSTITTFPGVALNGGGVQSTVGGSFDGFVSRFNPELTALKQSTFLGSQSSDVAYALAVRPASGELYVAGATSGFAAGFPGVALNGGGAQSSSDGTVNGFISRLSIDLTAADVYPDAFGFAPRLGVPAGSIQISAPAAITGIAGSVPISIASTSGAAYCISGSAACGSPCSVLPYTNVASTITSGQFVCVRQSAPLDSPALVKSTLFAGTGQADFVVATGNIFTGCTLDVDGNNSVEALTDGLMLLRAMFGLTGTAVTGGAVGGNATRSTWAQIQPYLNANCGTSFSP